MEIKTEEITSLLKQQLKLAGIDFQKMASYPEPEIHAIALLVIQQ